MYFCKSVRIEWTNARSNSNWNHKLHSYIFGIFSSTISECFTSSGKCITPSTDDCDRMAFRFTCFHSLPIGPKIVLGSEQVVRSFRCECRGFRRSVPSPGPYPNAASHRVGRIPGITRSSLLQRVQIGGLVQENGKILTFKKAAAVHEPPPLPLPKLLTSKEVKSEIRTQD